MANFTPYSALAGGLLIGLAAVVMMLLQGRTDGISGIVGGLLRPRRGDAAWRIAFLLGLFAAPATFAWLAPAGLPPMPRIDASSLALVGAGLLVGFGTRHASGCTSGHGVCGLARFSPRSLVATLVFMAAGAAVVFVIRHILGT